MTRGRAAARSAFAAILVSTLAVVACSPADVNGASDSGVLGPSGDAGGSADGEAGSGTNSACRNSAYARCSKLVTCSPSSLENRYGTVAACEQLSFDQCAAAASATGSGQTASQISTCVSALPSWSCADFLLGQNTPPACATAVGSLSNGASCLVSQQCQSAFCNVPTGGTCGVCAAALQLHDSCAASNCPATLICEATTKTCETYSQLGATCGSSAPCAIGLTCTAGANGSTCASSMATLDQPCVFSGPGCNFAAGFVCNVNLGTCQQVQIAASGGACGLVGGQQNYCSAGTCVSGDCVGLGLPGQPCSLAAGSVPCISETRCITGSDGGTAGTCQVLGQGSCR